MHYTIFQTIYNNVLIFLRHRISMSIHFSKFGKIAEATIELEGLTVIAGRNDTGKSTIGKALYSLIKSIRGFPLLYIEMKQLKAYYDLLSIIFELLKSYKGTKDNSLYKQMLDIRSAFFDIGNFPNINNSKNIEDYLNIATQYSQIENVEEDLKNKIQQITIELHREATDDEKFSDIIGSIFGKNFKKQFNNSVTREDAKISYSIGQNEIASVNFKNNSYPVGHLDVDYKSTSFSDATFIESPLYLEEEHKSQMSFAKDLKDKIDEARKKYSEIDGNSDIIKEIDDILESAKFNYNEKPNEWWKYIVKKGADPLFIENIASGSKSLGILYILLKTEIISKDSLIILDEPENHLHPEWQIRYAEVICKMVKNGFYVLLTSHSPYMIQALKTYSEKEGIFDKKVNFYFAEKEKKSKNYSVIENVRDEYGNFNDSKIFKSLYSPLETLDEVYSKIVIVE